MLRSSILVIVSTHPRSITNPASVFTFPAHMFFFPSGRSPSDTPSTKAALAGHLPFACVLVSEAITGRIVGHASDLLSRMSKNLINVIWIHTVK